MADKAQGITKITVQGFKSLYNETEVEIRPLTILAGANSSGKSSIMQPLLLMKQTLESEYVPNIFLLDGPNVRYTDVHQFLPVGEQNPHMKVSIELDTEGKLSVTYSLDEKGEFRIEETTFISSTNETRFKNQAGSVVRTINLRHGMSYEELESQLPIELDNLRQALENMTAGGKVYWDVTHHRCFLNMGMVFEDGTPAMEGDPLPLAFFPLNIFMNRIQDIIHVPGLRDNPRRNYPVTAITSRFEGTFDQYFASVIAFWDDVKPQDDKDHLLARISSNLMDLELGSGMGTSRRQNEIEIRVTHSTSFEHLINIADVGLGISQALPVLVALLVAKPGQLVYIEQPELHLHPRAQVKLAQILADAANRGVRVVVETHSSLLLLGLQTLIAEGNLAPEKTILHWFTRDEEGKSTVRSEVPDENGAYGDWPEDFADVELDAQRQYLDAVSMRQAGD